MDIGVRLGDAPVATEEKATFLPPLETGSVKKNMRDGGKGRFLNGWINSSNWGRVCLGVCLGLSWGVSWFVFGCCGAVLVCLGGCLGLSSAAGELSQEKKTEKTVEDGEEEEVLEPAGEDRAPEAAGLGFFL